MSRTPDQLKAAILNRGTETVVPGAQELATLLNSGQTLNVYLGIDPTATHIHLGHAVPLRKLQALAELGHNVYFLIGDFTAIVGDTSDKNTERPMLSRADIDRNFQTYQAQASKIVDFSKVKVVHNSEWLKKLGFADLLQLTAQFSVNDFISRELIRNRLQAGTRVSLSEVLYPIMQGFDSLHLATDIQLGGTDQIFNMQAGRTMIKKNLNKESFVLANGFLLGTDGRKMSKSWGNAIWLDDTPEDMFGKVMSLKDDLIIEYFTLATNATDEEIAAHASTLASGANPITLKKELATRIVTELYDANAAEQAHQHFIATVQDKVAPENIKTVSLPSASLALDGLLELLVTEQMVTSKSEGRRLLQQHALYLNDVTIDDQSPTLDLSAPKNVIRVGKRKYLQLTVQG